MKLVQYNECLVSIVDTDGLVLTMHPCVSRCLRVKIVSRLNEVVINRTYLNSVMALQTEGLYFFHGMDLNLRFLHKSSMESPLIVVNKLIKPFIWYIYRWIYWVFPLSSWLPYAWSIGFPQYSHDILMFIFLSVWFMNSLFNEIVLLLEIEIGTTCSIAYEPNMVLLSQSVVRQTA